MLDCTNKIFTSSDKVNPIDLLNSMRSRYAQPIHDNINAVREYENFANAKFLPVKRATANRLRMRCKT